jgi:hypothetical protein
LQLVFAVNRHRVAFHNCCDADTTFELALALSSSRDKSLTVVLFCVALRASLKGFWGTLISRGLRLPSDSLTSLMTAVGGEYARLGCEQGVSS